MTATIAFDPTAVQSLPGESLLLMRIILGRKAARLVAAELDRRALNTGCPTTSVGQTARSGKPGSRRRKAA